MDKFNVVIDLMWKTNACARARVLISFCSANLRILVYTLCANCIHEKARRETDEKENEGALWV